MNILLFGPQGSGKGTQARLICDKYDLFYFESGAFLRKVAAKNKDLKKSLAQGNMVPDKEMTSYLTAYLDKENLYDDIVFDGFPRTVDQYLFLRKWLLERKVSLDLALILNIPEEETLRRLSARRLDPKTGIIYNLITEPPPANIKKSRLLQRDDDKPESIKRRLHLYHERTEPLITEIRRHMKIAEFDGMRSIEAIFTDICVEINKVLEK